MSVVKVMLRALIAILSLVHIDGLMRGHRNLFQQPYRDRYLLLNCWFGARLTEIACQHRGLLLRRANRDPFYRSIQRHQRC